jgi:hypothetical protein
MRVPYIAGDLWRRRRFFGLAAGGGCGIPPPNAFGGEESPVRLICYARVSSTEQAEEGVSLQSQRERIHAWAFAMGHTVVRDVEDAGVSGSIDPEKRAGFRSVLAALAEGHAEGVVAVALDRYSRTVLHMLGLAEKFRAEGWALNSLRESLDSTTTIGRFTLTILAGVAAITIPDAMKMEVIPAPVLCDDRSYGVDSTRRKIIYATNPDSDAIIDDATKAINNAIRNFPYSF